MYPGIQSHILWYRFIKRYIYIFPPQNFVEDKIAYHLIGIMYTYHYMNSPAIHIKGVENTRGEKGRKNYLINVKNNFELE